MNPLAGDSDALSRPFKDQSIIVTHPEAMSLRLVERAARVGSATVHEATGRIGALPCRGEYAASLRYRSMNIQFLAGSWRRHAEV